MPSLRRCSRLWWLSSLLAIAAAAGCGGDGAGSRQGADEPAAGPDEDPQGGHGAGEGEGEVEPAADPEIPIDPPAPTELPKFADWTCPEGWSPRAVEQGEPWAYSICEVASPPDCEGASFALPGDVLCRPLGRACDADFSLDGVVIHVDPAAAAGGDGSRDSPLNDLVAALALPHAAGATVRLAAGEHPGAITVDRPVTLVGACTSGVVVGPVTVAAAGPVVLDNLSVRPGNPAVAVGPEATDVSLVDVLIEGPTDMGLHSAQQGGTLDLRRLVVRDISTDNPFALGAAVFLRSAGRTTIRESLFEDCAGACFFAGAHHEAGVGALSIERSIIRRSLSPLEHVPGLIRLFDGAGATLREMVLEHGGSIGVLIGQAGGGSPPLVTVTDSVIRDISGDRATGENGSGIGLLNAGRLIVERTLFERIGGAAVTVTGHPSGRAGIPSADLTDVVVRDSVVFGTVAGGALVEGAGVLHLRRVLTQRVGAFSLAVSVGTDAQAELDLEDVVVRAGVATQIDEVRAWPGAGSTRVIADIAAGVLVSGGDLTGRRVAVVEQPRGGVVIQGLAERAPVVELTDVYLRGLLDSEVEFPDLDEPPTTTLPAQGLAVIGGAQVEIRRVAGEAIGGQLLFTAGDPNTGTPMVRLIDARGGDFLESPDGRTGLAVGAANGAQISLLRTELNDSKVMGIVSWGWPLEPQTDVSLDHVVVRGVGGGSCGEIPEGEPGSCNVDGRTEAGGIGFLAREGGTLTAWDFDVRHAALAGIIVASGSQIELHRGVITESAIGLNIMNPDQDLELLGDEVFVFDNAVDVARQTLLLPAFGGLFAGDDEGD